MIRNNTNENLPVFQNPDLNTLIRYMDQQFRQVYIRLEDHDSKFDYIAEILRSHSGKLDMITEMVGGQQIDIQNLKDTTSAHTDLHREHERKFKSFDKRITVLKTA